MGNYSRPPVIGRITEQKIDVLLRENEKRHIRIIFKSKRRKVWEDAGTWKECFFFRGFNSAVHWP